MKRITSTDTYGFRYKQWLMKNHLTEDMIRAVEVKVTHRASHGIEGGNEQFNTNDISRIF